MQPTRNIHRCPEAMRPGACSVRLAISIALLSAGFAATSVSPASAQLATTAPQATAASTDGIRQREQELEATRAQQKTAAEAEAKLKLDIAAIGQDRSKLNAQLIDIAAQVRGFVRSIHASSKFVPRSRRAVPRSSRCWLPCNARGGARRRPCW